MPYKKLYKNGQEPIEISTDAEMAAVLLDDTNLGKVYKFTGTSGTYINGDLYETDFSELSRPLCFTANTAGSSVTFTNEGYTGTCWTGSYSTDGKVWHDYIPNVTGGITLNNVGAKVYFKGNMTRTGPVIYSKFSMTGSIAASGNVNSMYISEGFENLTTLTYVYCYQNMFYNCTSLTSAPLLPATSLISNCYQSMFNGCTSLTAAPQLPATTLSMNCYTRMFAGCTSLTTPPILPATTLANSCYSNMFDGCTSLQVNDSPATGVAEHTWNIPNSGKFPRGLAFPQSGMFTNCAGTRSSDDMPGAASTSYTYYTQNPPV